MAAIKDSSTNQENKRIIETKCPVTYTLHKIGGRWKPLVINQLSTGIKRYGELKKALPAISEKMLIQTLKEMEADELIIRKSFPVTPPHVEYSLSPIGKDLIPVLNAMKDWGLRYNV